MWLFYVSIGLLSSLIFELSVTADSEGFAIGSRYRFRAISSLRESREENCCGDLGCFDVAGLFLDILKRPINPYPSCEARVKLSLKTQDNVMKPDILDPFDIQSVNESHFSPDREGVKILIHGFMDTDNVHWMTLMEPKLLLQGDYNVIRADWSGSAGTTYFQAAANTRVVGAIVARLISTLEQEFGQDLGKVHILGHSLGAHIAGYVGKRVKIGRITAFDPAGLYFKDMPAIVRLDSADASLVETVVTDGRDLLQLGYGTMQPLGHVNFYPNGGRDQPGCGKSLLASLWNLDLTGMSNDALGCSHFRAPVLYADAIANPTCTFTAIECDSYDSFRTGKCFSCARNRCKTFGIGSELVPTAGHGQKMYYFLTRAAAPFCESLYKVTIRISAKMRAPEHGMIKLQLNGSKRSSDWTDFRNEATELNPGMSHSCLVAAPQNLGNLTSITMSWHYDYSVFRLLAFLSSHVLRLEPTIEVTLLETESIRLKTDTTDLDEDQLAVFRRMD